MFHNKLIDNSSYELSMQTSLKLCMARDDINQIRMATGYWDIPGMALIIDELSSFLSKENTSMKLLIGKDPYVYTSLLKNPKYKNSNYPDDFIRTDICALEVKEEYERVVNLLLTYCENGKLQIKIYKQNNKQEVEFLHSKCYIFSGKNYSMGIIGSSNFTEKGLLGNAELNYLETDSTRVAAEPKDGSMEKGHIYWFEEKWALSTDWTKEFLEQVIKPTPISKKIQKSKANDFTPYELYIKLLQMKFGDIIDQSLGQQIESYLPSKIRKLDYQIEAVKRCINIMHEHGGFMLADVVGLGKTIIGTLIIKRFLSSSEYDDRERKVLIVSPPAILSGWKKAIAMFDKDRDDKIAQLIDFITTGSIGNIVDDEGYDDDNFDTGSFDGKLQEKNYGLIIIDESHKFRNSRTLMYASLDNLIQKIGISTGTYPYIGLLSATPQNNHPNDLKNQIYLFERNRIDSTLKKAEAGNLEKFFSNISKEYDILINRKTILSAEERKARLNEVSKKIRDGVLTDILERRTRTDIEKYYKKDIQSEELIFPKIIGPNNLEYVMDEELAVLFSDTMKIIAPTDKEKTETSQWLKYFRYRAIEYFVDSKNTAKHTGGGNLSVGDVAKRLANIMQILLVKRLESSFSAFTQSLLNLRKYTDNMINMWENDTIFICPQIDVNKELDIQAKEKNRGKPVSFNDCVNDLRQKIQKLNQQGRNEKQQNAEYRRKDFKEAYYHCLKEDRRLISDLYDRWAANTEDPKFDTFKEKLKPELFNPDKNTSGKLVIFSEAIDTVKSLARAVKAKGYRPLVVTAENRDEKEHTIEENFDANYEGEQKDDYNVIITTEVLSEGINLHRANVILNYDTPWNATKLMQRIGRVNRIGSKEPFVYVYNFMPSAEGDAQIKLVRKAHIKLQSFHILFGEDSKIFTDEESLKHYEMTKSIGYDIEEEESPLQKYIYELKEYKKDNADRYAQIEKANADKWQIAQSNSGNAYFVVKAPFSAQLVIQLILDKEQSIVNEYNYISYLELLERLQVQKDAQVYPLPEKWQQLSEKAIDLYNKYFIRINKSRVGDKRERALEFIVNLYNSPYISKASKDILIHARNLVDRGSCDLIKTLLMIEQRLNSFNQDLFSISQQDIDDILNEKLKNLVADVKKKQGQASILVGTIK